MILDYGLRSARLTSCHLVFQRPPQQRFDPDDSHEGAWLVVREPGGRAIYAVPLRDPRLGQEHFDDGVFTRRTVDGAPRRVTAVAELPFAGSGTVVDLHVSRPTRKGVIQPSRVLGHLVLDPPPLVRAFDPDVVIHPDPGWGQSNPNAKTLLFLPDGFGAADMDSFHAAIEGVKRHLAETLPFKEMLTSMRVAHVNIVSNQRGIGATAGDTAFRGRFTIPRVIEVDQTRAAQALERHASGISAIALIVANTLEYGGSGGAATVFSLNAPWSAEIAIHELGHSWFNLADEYEAGGQAKTMEPVEANVCARADRARLKWAASVANSTPLPTVENEPHGVIGAFEGAKYRSKGIFRPAIDCKMRTPGSAFCAVCAALIISELERHAP